MIFKCPNCGKQLNGTYFVNSEIRPQDHPGQKCTEGGIGGIGLKATEMSTNQKKSKEKAYGLETAKKSKEEKSVANLNAYQTPLKKQGLQEVRENKAKEIGLKGHHSATSNSGQNSGTSNGLNKINSSTK